MSLINQVECLSVPFLSAELTCNYLRELSIHTGFGNQIEFISSGMQAVPNPSEDDEDLDDEDLDDDDFDDEDLDDDDLDDEDFDDDEDEEFEEEEEEEDI